MSRQSSFCSTLALGVMLGLAGCGGSGSDNSGANLSDPGNSNPPQSQGESVTITGQVTDMPIANARVVVTVGGQRFEAAATTDANGNYEIEITHDDPDSLVLMEAFDPATGIHFTALLDDFGGFQSEADTDGHVSDVDITNVTTAHYVLARSATDDGSIDDLDELDEAAERIDTAAVLELSAAIKLVVENIDGVVLPGEFASTQELAEAIIAGTSSFLDDVELLAPDALDEAMDLVVNDGNATLAWNADRVPGVYVHREGFSLYAMFADGTGLAASFERDAVARFQWAVNDQGKLIVVYETDAAETDVVTLLSRHRNVLSVMVEERGRAGDAVRGEPATVRYFPFAERSFSDDNVPGTYSTMGEPGRVKVFLAEHTGYDLDLETGLQSDHFTWEVDSRGTLHIVTTGGILAHSARVLAGAADDGLHLLVREYDVTGALTHVDVITVRRSDAIASTPSDVADQNLRLAGSAYAFLGEDEVSMFRFRADGMLRQVSQFPSASGYDLVDRGGEWTMVDDQTLRTRFDDSPEAEDVRLLDGIGADRMLVQTPEDIAAGTERLVTRIAPVDADTMLGVFYILDASGQIQNEFVQLNADYTGSYWVDGAIEDEFEWSIDEHGSIVVSIDTGTRVTDETMTLHMLADSTATDLRFIAVRRVNGRLQADDSDGRALTVLHLWREG